MGFDVVEDGIGEEVLGGLVFFEAGSDVGGGDVDQGGLQDVFFEAGDFFFGYTASEGVELAGVEAGSGGGDDGAEVDELIDFVPLGEVFEGVGADEPIEVGAGAYGFAEVAEGVDGVAGGVSLEFAIGDFEAAVSLYGTTGHGEAVLGVGEFESGFVWRVGGGD